MSRAFVREDDIGQDAPPERSRSPHPNYMTRAGLERLRARFEALAREREALAGTTELGVEDALRHHDRDLAWLRERIEQAIVIVAEKVPRDRVGFGATVEVRGEDGGRRSFTLVGEDEADVKGGRINWSSPLGRALLGARVGDIVTWRRPNGDREIEIVGFNYGALT